MNNICPIMADMDFLNNPGINYKDILAPLVFKRAYEESWITLIDFGPDKYDRPLNDP